MAIHALQKYSSKNNRHKPIVSSNDIDEYSACVLRTFEEVDNKYAKTDEMLYSAFGKTDSVAEIRLRKTVAAIPPSTCATFLAPRKALKKVMGKIAQTLSEKWDTDRYVREESIYE